MESIEIVLIDDEVAARILLREYLADYGKVNIVGEASNGLEALELLSELKPDLIFLDINMPEMTGFELLEHLEEIPSVIFSTAHDEYALAAFEEGALDYLLKPISKSRFEKAFNRYLERRAKQAESEVNRKELQAAVEESISKEGFPTRFFVRSGSKIVPVDVSDILWVEAAGDYSNLHTMDGKSICNLGIGALEGRLDPKQFIRVHRSSIIAYSALKHLSSDGEGGYITTLVSGAKVRVSRKYAESLRRLIV